MRRVSCHWKKAPSSWNQLPAEEQYRRNAVPSALALELLTRTLLQL